MGGITPHAGIRACHILEEHKLLVSPPWSAHGHHAVTLHTGWMVVVVVVFWIVKLIVNR